MGNYVLRRLLILVPSLLGISVVLFTVLALYPFIESWVTGDKREHNLLDRPRNAPTRTALGMMAISVVLAVLLSGFSAAPRVIATRGLLLDLAMILAAFAWLPATIEIAIARCL